MAYDDGYYYGLAKVVALATKDEDNGKTVTVTNGTKTWTGTMADGKCTFTVPGKDRYTMRLGTYSKVVDISYGECVGVYMADGYDLVYQKDIDKLRQDFQAGVDSIYDAVVAEGATPDSKALSDVVAAIGTLGDCKITVNYKLHSEMSKEYGSGGSVVDRADANGSFTITIENNQIKEFTTGGTSIHVKTGGDSGIDHAYTSVTITGVTITKI